IALAVVERNSVIFIEGECGIRAGIDPESHRGICFLARVLLHRSQRKNGARADVERHGREIHRPADLAASFEFLLRPEVIPGPAWEIQWTRGRALFGDGRDQDIPAQRYSSPRATATG